MLVGKPKGMGPLGKPLNAYKRILKCPEDVRSVKV
jgi:hypothetical protein